MASNVDGKYGKRQLNPHKMAKIKEAVFILHVYSLESKESIYKIHVHKCST